MKRLEIRLPVGGKKKFNMIDLIMSKRKLIEGFFMMAVVFSCIATCFVGMNYDMGECLPSYAPSKKELDLMEEEFGYPGTARVMVRPVSLYETKTYRDEITAVDDVDMVMWADTTTSIYDAQHFIEYESIEDYYRDEYAVVDVILEKEDSNKLTRPALNEMKTITGDKGYFMGSAVQNGLLSETLIKEMSMALVVDVITIAAILYLTITSWFEPALSLMVMGIAIIINMGTDLMIGTVSFTTFSVASILQLTIAMDYPMFLLHFFTKMELKGLPAEETMVQAIRNSLSSILASRATTIVGFIVLMLMRFSIR